MARFNGENIDNYGSQSSGGGYFSLKDDGDVARVRLMYNGADDIEGYSVHEVQIGDRKRYVNCLREYNSPIDDCPFCRERMGVKAKLFVPIFNEDSNQVQLWERGRKFYGKLSGICSRYKNTVSHIFEIERNGKKGDQQTTYEIFEVDSDDMTLDELPELPKVLGTIVLDKTAQDMEDFLEVGSFPDDNNTPVRRRSSSDSDSDRREVTRRTPTNRGDRF